MKIYDYPGAPHPRRVRIFLSEKGIDVPYETVDILKRASRSEAFIEKNPLGGIPVLELDDGTHIAESVAICRYFEAIQPAPPLFGETAVEIAAIEMWLRRIDLYLMTQVGLVWVHGNKLTAHLLEQKADVAEFGRARTLYFYGILDQALQDREFLASDRYSVAESIALPTLDFACGLADVPYSDKFVNLRRWHEMMLSRDSADS